MSGEGKAHVCHKNQRALGKQKAPEHLSQHENLPIFLELDFKAGGSHAFLSLGYFSWERCSMIEGERPHETRELDEKKFRPNPLSSHMQGKGRPLYGLPVSKGKSGQSLPPGARLF